MGRIKCNEKMAGGKLFGIWLLPEINFSSSIYLCAAKSGKPSRVKKKREKLGGTTLF